MNEIDPRELSADEITQVSGGAIPVGSAADLMQLMAQILNSIQGMTNSVMRNLN
jgi:hypothetical protein